MFATVPSWTVASLRQAASKVPKPIRLEQRTKKCRPETVRHLKNFVYPGFL
jgi:hypothetical protein